MITIKLPDARIYLAVFLKKVMNKKVVENIRVMRRGIKLKALNIKGLIDKGR